MSEGLVIVESPTKAKTLNRFLGRSYDVLASYGHVRDLLPKKGAVDPDRDFHMHYNLIEKNSGRVGKIASSLGRHDVLYLATDPDREGEAIAWHLLELLSDKGALAGKKVIRLSFHEITKEAIDASFQQPGDVSMDLVNAQQARRALDYLVGFNLSPLLWRKISAGLSAGRVQSPALRLIVEREVEIRQFKVREYWTIEGKLSSGGAAFTSRLSHYDGKKLEQFSIENEDKAKQVVAAVDQAARGELIVSSHESKERRRRPSPPFTTSTLQQEAARKLGFSVKKTMMVAQQLYEGMEVGGGLVGLITYMRTDSVSLSADALKQCRKLIAARYDNDYLPARAITYKTKAKNAQEAHEAIRPTMLDRTPESVKGQLPRDLWLLYDLVWKRTIACQMAAAIVDTVAVQLACPDSEKIIFRATGSTVRFPGFLAVYEAGRDEDSSRQQVTTTETVLPPLKKGDKVKLDKIIPSQHFTTPPPRYTEASLVRTLEEYGIGRPSTYASIISTLQNRKYVELKNKSFVSTETGEVVNNFLTEHFAPYVDYDFTARMEDDLDAISRGEKEWVAVLRAFWNDFIAQVELKSDSVSRKDAVGRRELGTDPKSGKPVFARLGRFGPCVQVGEAEDEEKPKFAGLMPGQRLETITLEEALKLFVLPRSLGNDSEGNEIFAGVSRFGGYVRQDSIFASLTRDESPYTVTIERALELIEEKKERERKRNIKEFGEDGIKILQGRWGPYVTDGKVNARVPKDVEPGTISLQDARQMLSESQSAPRRAAKKRPTRKKKSKASKS